MHGHLVGDTTHSFDVVGDTGHNAWFKPFKGASSSSIYSNIFVSCSQIATRRGEFGSVVQRVRGRENEISLGESSCGRGSGGRLYNGKSLDSFQVIQATTRLTICLKVGLANELKENKKYFSEVGLIGRFKGFWSSLSKLH